MNCDGGLEEPKESRLNLVSLVPHVPVEPAKNAGVVYVHRHLNYLRDHFNTAVLAPGTLSNVQSKMNASDVVDVHLWPVARPKSYFGRLASYVKYLSGGLGPGSEIYRGLTADRRALAILESADIVEIHHAPGFAWIPMIRSLPGTRRIVSVSHDIYTDALTSLAKGARNPWRRFESKVLLIRTRRQEPFWLDQSDLTLVFGKRDQRLLEELGVRTPTRVISPFVELPDSPLPQEGSDVVFVAAFGRSQNADSAIWFVKEVWPLVMRQLPNARLRLVGSDPPRSVLALSSGSVEVTGFVGDLGTIYRNAAVAIAPLRTGAGVKFKVVQALAYGRPVVSTSIGIEGIDLPADPRLLRVADDPRGFADSLVEALGEVGDETICYRAHEFAMTHYSFDRSMAGIGSTYRDLALRAKRLSNPDR